MDYITWKALFVVLGALIGAYYLIARDKEREKRERNEQDREHE